MSNEEQLTESLMSALDAARQIEKEAIARVRSLEKMILDATGRDVSRVKKNKRKFDQAPLLIGPPPRPTGRSVREIILDRPPHQSFGLGRLMAELDNEGNDASRDSVLSILSRMKSDGFISSAGRARYSVVSPGPDDLAEEQVNLAAEEEAEMLVDEMRGG